MEGGGKASAFARFSENISTMKNKPHRENAVGNKSAEGNTPVWFLDMVFVGRR